MRSLPLALALLALPLLLPQLPAQDVTIARAAARIDTAIPWMTDGFYPADPGRPVATLPRTGVDRGKLLDDALQHAMAEEKPVLWYIPRIEGGHMVRPEFLDTYMRVVAFTDPVLTSFIRARFVPLRMAVDGPISKRTGITKLDWIEPALVILDANGKIVRRLDRIRTFHRDLFERFLLDAVGENVPLAKPSGAGAAKYALAMRQLLGGQTEAAEATLREVVEEFEDFEDQWPYAAMAAVNLMKGRDTTTVGPAFHGFEDPTPLPKAAYAESRPSTAWPRPVGKTDDVAKRAVAWLLRHQNQDGSFSDSRYALCDSPRILPNVWIAITAIALAGLSDWRDVDREAIDAAIARGERYLFDGSNVAVGRNEECYADTFRVIYLWRHLARHNESKTSLRRRRLHDIAGCLVDQQSEAGWLAHEYPNPFATAAAMVALADVRFRGGGVPDSFFERGAKALRSVRGDGGIFAYGARGKPSGSESAFKNAMGRMPVCEHALLRVEHPMFPHLAPEAPVTGPLEAALDNFWTWLPRLERIRVCDFHADGELGGFFFWHAMFLTSEAINSLPVAKRAAHNQKMLEHVMKIGEIDGSFVDSHEVGKSYGTGMALMILRNSSRQTE